jgi:hypothetical protein
MAYDSNVNIQTWVQSNPVQQNLNYLAPSSFVFTMQNLPTVAFTCQTANIPNTTLGMSTQFTRVKDTPVPGDTLQFGDLLITFLVDEDMVNYKALYTWMRAVSGDIDTKEYTDYINSSAAHPAASSSTLKPIAPTMTDATMTITNSSNNANVEIRFKDLFPTSLEALQFDITDTSMPYITASASFSFSWFDIVKL